MAVAWTNIPDGDVDPESPITTSLMVALRDNPEGIAGGAGGAPKIITGAITDLAVTTAKLAAGAATAAKVGNLPVSQITSGIFAIVRGGTGVATGDFGNTKSIAGKQNLPNGLIFQWGSNAVNADSNLDINLSATYPNAHLVAIACYGEGLTALDNPCGAGPLSTTQIRLTNGDGTTRTIRWFSIGH